MNYNVIHSKASKLALVLNLNLRLTDLLIWFTFNACRYDTLSKNITCGFYTKFLRDGYHTQCVTCFNNLSLTHNFSL